MPANIVDEKGRGSRQADRQVDSICPYCGVGCQITYNIRKDEETGQDHIAFVEGKGGPANENRLCVKGPISVLTTSHLRNASPSR